MGNIGPWEIILLLLLALLLFGAKRLPEIGRSLGSGMREFKDSVSGVKEDITPPSELTSGISDSEPASVAPREHDTV
jgi:sec-independent protein translocase protein TatA